MPISSQLGETSYLLLATAMSLQLAAAIRSYLLRIDPSEVLFESRGFQPSKQQDHMESIGGSFLLGYHLALQRQSGLMRGELDTLDALYRGFAYEGAGMALGLCDQLSLTSQRNWHELLQGVGSAHCYLVYVGLGWAYARIPWIRRNPEKYIAGLDPLLRWLVLDGFGFHEGYFYWAKQLGGRACAFRLSEYGKRAFDQGLGRSLWFVTGGIPVNIVQTLESVPFTRRADFWSGLGLAITYAGEASSEDIEHLLDKSSEFRAHFAQGVAFGAEARSLAESTNDNTELVCNHVWAMPTCELAALTNAARPVASTHPETCHPVLYEQWRTNIRESLKCHVRLGT